jgi:hypothetical protein
MKNKNNGYFASYENNGCFVSYEMALEIVFGKATQFAHPAPSLSNCVANQR